MREFIAMINAKSRLYLPLLLILILVTFTLLTLSVNQFSKNLRGKAVEATASVVRGQSGDLWADIIIGKTDFSEIVPNTIVGNKFFYPHSVIVDRSVTPNRMFIYDGGNSRIIGISDIGRCTSQGPNCVVDATQGDIVLGQTNFTSASCNGDSAFQSYPDKLPASASTFCSLPTEQLSVGENSTGSSMYVDSQGSLYVNDMYNHRVLKYNSPFTTDTVADDVWGQNDFTGNNCNKGQSNPDANSLCFGWSGNNNWSAGVDVDTQGNLWVADSSNNRVLRFPAGSHTADIVLGQQSFSTRTTGNGLDQLYAPSAVRVNAQGWVYVADYNNNRVLVYENPATGATGRAFVSTIGFPEGLDFDPTEAGKIWVASRSQHAFYLYDETTGQVSRTLGVPGNGNIVNAATGSLGIGSSGGYYVAVPGADYGNDVIYFPANGPYNTPTKRLFGGFNVVNKRDAAGIGGGVGVVVYENGATSQLIVMDNFRILFWNNLSSLTNSKPADGVAEITDFSQKSPAGEYSIIKASRNHLYVGRKPHNLPMRIEVYNLPLTMGAQPITYLSSPFNVLGGGQMTTPYTGEPNWGIAPTDDDQFLWITHSDTSRVFRVKNPLTAPVVDVVLGQNNLTDTQCNRGAAPRIGATPTSLCWPGWLTLDRNNNLFVSDHSLETRGNYRELVFSHELFPDNPNSVIFAPAATKIFTDVAMAEVAFNSQNQMVGGYQRYWTPNPNQGIFPGVYLDPLNPNSFTPNSFLQDFSSAAFAMTFDSQDNLYVGDWARNRIHVYFNPLGTQTPSSTPTPPVATVTPTTEPPTSTPVPPTPTPTPNQNIVFSNVSATNITANSAVISWTTNIASSTRVSYGLQQNNLNLITAENQTLVISHTMNLSNLQANKKYYYRVRSRNAQGTEFISNIFNFRTTNQASGNR